MREAKPRTELNNLKTYLRYPCLGLNTIIDSIKLTVLLWCINNIIIYVIFLQLQLFSFTANFLTFHFVTINHIKGSENTFTLLVFSASKRQKICQLSVYLLKTCPLSKWSMQHHKTIVIHAASQNNCDPCSITKQLWSMHHHKTIVSLAVKASYIRSCITSCQILLIACYFQSVQTRPVHTTWVIGCWHLF